ncbi:DUF1698 domain-containing protein [Klebsiella pneumoniae]|nr:DUF1698 domain-containing protein [Klebsiella pneumoniae]
MAARRRDALHGKFREWERAVEFLAGLTPASGSSASVTAESETPLGEGHRRRINLAKAAVPWRKGPLLAQRSINIDTE